MAKSGLCINGNKACDINKHSAIKIISQSFYTNQNNKGGAMFKNINYGNIGYINQGIHKSQNKDNI